jgi:hypothetical protein
VPQKKVAIVIDVSNNDVVNSDRCLISASNATAQKMMSKLVLTSLSAYVALPLFK